MFNAQQTSIHKLPQNTINQIAAGEVVERPAHLLKELLENSIDAGAKCVEVDFSKGGKNICVKDDGHGIADLPLALARHATSKIQNTEDLWHLKSFGFRGEALASISAVSQITITSAPKGDRPHFIKCAFGDVSNGVLPAHRDQGTTVEVTDLFKNTPARLKFLKSEASEATQIKKTLKALAMIHPPITFKLLQEGRLLHYFSSTPSFHERVKQVLADPSLYYFKSDYLHFCCEMVFGRPHSKQKNSQNIWLFVQRRWVQDLQLKMAIIESYRNLLMHGTYPVAALNLTCDPSAIDVNIHPTKSQVKFQNPTDAFRAVAKPLRQQLEKAPWLKDILGAEENLKPEKDLDDFLGPKDSGFRDQWASESSLPNDFIQNTNLKKGFHKESFQNKPSFIKPLSAKSPSLLPDKTEVEKEPRWGDLEVLGQCNLTYILTQSKKSLILVDQHAAHERVAFEKLMQSWKKKQFEVQKNLIPQTLKIDPALCDRLLKCKAHFEDMGIELEGLGPDTLAINSKPSILSEKSLALALTQTAQQMEDLGDSFAFDRIVGDLFATMACHSVIRAGQALKHEEMKSLLGQMDAFSLSSFCPHGRPVFVNIPFSKLDREFGRIV